MDHFGPYGYGAPQPGQEEPDKDESWTYIPPTSGGISGPDLIKWPDHFKSEDIEALKYSMSAMAHNIKRLADAAEKQAKYQKQTLAVLLKMANEMKK